MPRRLPQKPAMAELLQNTEKSPGAFYMDSGAFTVSGGRRRPLFVFFDEGSSLLSPPCY